MTRLRQVLVLVGFVGLATGAIGGCFEDAAHVHPTPNVFHDFHPVPEKPGSIPLFFQSVSRQARSLSEATPDEVKGFADSVACQGLLFMSENQRFPSQEDMTQIVVDEMTSKGYDAVGANEIALEMRSIYAQSLADPNGDIPLNRVKDAANNMLCGLITE
jgi:hypothetical protein